MHTTIAIVEDDEGICEELKHLIARAEDLTCVCICRNTESAVRRIPSLGPDVIIMDVRLPDGSGIDCTARLKRVLPDSQILMFTINDDTDQIVKALEAGASGYLLKDSGAAEILASIREVRNQGAPMSREVARKLVDSFHRHPMPRDSGDALTPREEEILRRLSEGLLYKEIGDRLGIKIDTVGTHIKSIYRKLHVRSRTEAVMKRRR
jgi:DNA-binding NarL/FixJ family response regulator